MSKLLTHEISITLRKGVVISLHHSSRARELEAFPAAPSDVRWWLCPVPGMILICGYALDVFKVGA